MPLPEDRLFKASAGNAEGALIARGGDTWYVVHRYDALQPFLMSIVSSADHWLFVSSRGGLTAGRRSAEHALFPYVTDDKLHYAHHHTGPLTIFRTPALWEPLSDRCEGHHAVERHLYKSILGHQVCFEEVNLDLELRFSYTWQTCDRYGFVRQVTLANEGSHARTIHVLDGLRNMLPHGVSLGLQNERSTLVDAYKRNELIGYVGVYALSAHIVDRPEPTESLRCTTAWSVGLDAKATLLSERQVSAFRRDQPIRSEHDVRAMRGTYLVASEITLSPGESRSWTFALDLNQGYPDVAALAQRLTQDPAALQQAVDRATKRDGDRLRRIIGLADGFQCTNATVINARHAANTLFNVMRGGMPYAQYRITRRDVVDFVETRNRPLAATLGERLPSELTIQALQEYARDDPKLRRLCLEYLPWTFSRRHGDPSRPWNQFSINVRHADGSLRLDYEGNWRDIFQNWEALALSYPACVVGMICTFVNASTADGYNPYRITRAGIDWEEPNPQDPWAHIGYWGDHQTVYLHRLLEIARSHYPALLPALLGAQVFAYANVPYRIKPYAALLADPHDTLTFDAALAARIEARVRALGTDGKLVLDQQGSVLLVTLAEKLIVSICARLSSFIPGAGIWMNTQRPEWNDANNALVGWGVSVVTLCYLRPLLLMCAELFAQCGDCAVMLSEEVAAWRDSLQSALERGLEGRLLMDALSKAGSDYRQGFYTLGFTGSVRSVQGDDLAGFCRSALRHIDIAIAQSRRQDGLYHAYNLIAHLGHADIGVGRLPLMLEGQVAALASGQVAVQEAIRLLKALRQSALWRANQKSYLLYPDRDLAGFMQKSIVPAALVERAPLLMRLIASGDDSIVGCTASGTYYFHPSLQNSDSVASALDALTHAGYANDVERDRAAILDIYEAVFSHRFFTGRSGVFFKYEGLGCIYWHMVSKLLLAVQEVHYRGLDAGMDAGALAELATLYYALRAGIGDHKTPEEYGAFPTDPYSHTPAHMGAQQPGMTGQVKEDILGRWNELGVRVRSGRLTFSGALLRPREFLRAPAPFTYYDTRGESRTVQLSPGTLGFTYIQVLIVYHQAAHPALHIQYASGASSEQATLALTPADSQGIFARTGAIDRIDVFLAPQGP